MDESKVIAKVNYSHEAMIDLLVHNPMMSQREIARHFGYTEGWVSRILRSDAFREQVAKRRDELIDPIVLHSIEERLSALVSMSTEVLMENLEAKRSTDAAIKALEVGSRALGYGIAKGAQVNVQQNFVVAMPQKEADSGSWIAAHKPQRLSGGPPIDVPVKTTVESAISGLEREIDAL